MSIIPGSGRYRVHELNRFVGGLAARPLASDEGEEFLNVRLGRDGYLRMRPGSTESTAGLPSGQSIDSLFTVRDGGTVYMIAVTSGRGVYTNTSWPGSWTLRGTLSSSRVRFATATLSDGITQVVLIADPLGAARYLKLSDLSLNNVHADVTGFGAVQVINNVAFWSASGGQLHRIRWSSPGDPLSYPVDQYMDINPGGGQVIGLAHLGSNLIIFKRRAILELLGGIPSESSAGVSFNVRSMYENLGPLSPYSFDVLGSEVYFSSSYGPYVLGAELQYLGDAIRELLTDGTVDHPIAATAFYVYFSRQGATTPYLYVLDRRFGGENSRGIWYRDLYKDGSGNTVSFNCLAITAGDEPLPMLYGGTSNGRVLRVEDTSQTTDSGQAILSAWTSREFEIDSPGYLKELRRLNYYLSGTVTLIFSTRSRTGVLSTPLSVTVTGPAEVVVDPDNGVPLFTYCRYGIQSTDPTFVLRAVDAVWRPRRFTLVQV